MPALSAILPPMTFLSRIKLASLYYTRCRRAPPACLLPRRSRASGGRATAYSLPLETSVPLTHVSSTQTALRGTIRSSDRIPWRACGSAIRRLSCCWHRTARPSTQLGSAALGRDEEHPYTGGLRSAQGRCPLEGRIFSLMSSSSFCRQPRRTTVTRRRRDPPRASRGVRSSHIHLFYSPECPPKELSTNIDSGEHSGIFSVWLRSIAFGGHAAPES